MDAEKSFDSQIEPQYISIKMEPVACFEETSMLETSHNKKDSISNDHFSVSPAAPEKIVDQHSTDQHSVWTLRSSTNEDSNLDNQSFTENLNSSLQMPENVTPEGGRKRCSQCHKKFAAAAEPHPNCLVHSMCFQNNVWDPRTCNYCNELLQQASAGDDLAQSLYKVRVRNMRQQAKRHHTYDHWIHSLAEGYLIDFKGVAGLERVSLNDVQDASTAHTPNISAMSTTSSQDDGHYQDPASKVKSRTSGRLSLQSRPGLLAEKPKKADQGQVMPRKRCTQCPYRVTAGDTHPNCLVHSICFQNYTWDPRYCNLCNAIQDRAKQGDFAALDLCKRRCNNMIKRATLKGHRNLWIHPHAYHYLPPSYRGLDGLGTLLPECGEDFSGNGLPDVPSQIKLDADHNLTSSLNSVSQQYENGDLSHSKAFSGSGRRKKCLRCSWSVTSDDEHPNCTRHSDCFMNGIWKPRECRYCLDLQSRADAGSKAAKLRLNKRLLNMRKCARKIPGSDWTSLTLIPSPLKECIDPVPKDCVDSASREFIDSASKECLDSESTATGCRHCLHIPHSVDPHPACTRHSACCRNNFWVPRDCQYCIQLKCRADEGDTQAQTVYKKRYVSMRMRAWRERIKDGRWIHPQCGNFLPPKCRTEQYGLSSEENLPMLPNFDGSLKRRCFKCCRGLKLDDPHTGCILHCDCFQKLVWDPRGCNHCVTLKQRALEAGNQTYRARYIAMRKHAWNNGFKGWIHPLAVKDYRYSRQGGIGTAPSQDGATRKMTLLTACPTPCSDGGIARPSLMQGDPQNEKRKLFALGGCNTDARIVKFSKVQTSRDSAAIASEEFADIEPQLPLNVYVKPGPKSKKMLYSNKFSNGNETFTKRSVASKLLDGSKMVSGTKQDFFSTMDLKPEPIVFTKVIINGTSMNSSSFRSPSSDKTDAFYEDDYTSSPMNSWNFKVSSSSKLHFVFKDLGLESCVKNADKASLYDDADGENSYSGSSVRRSTVADGDAIKILVVSIQKLRKRRISPKFCRVNGLSLSCGVALKKQLRMQKGGSSTNGRASDDGSMSSATGNGHSNSVKGLDVKIEGWAWSDHTELSSTPSVAPFKELSHETFRLPDGKYQCPICSLVVGTFVSYRQHYITHLGEKPFQCRQCSFKTRYPFQLKRHTIARHGYKASRLRDSLKVDFRGASRL